MKITNLLPEAGPYGSRNPDTMSASDYDRYQQDQMDQGKRDFKRSEHEAEWEREQEYTKQLQARDQGPWYLRIDGKILKSQGQPKVFDLKKGANNYALAIIKNKPELQGKIMLTKSDADQASTEAASGGSSSAGNVASSSGRIGPDTIVVQEHKKGVKAMKYTAKTRSPVAKAHQAIGSGSGEHTDKKKVASQVRGQKHKNKSTEIAESFNGEYDDEAGMAQSNLLTTARAVMGLLKTIKDKDNLPEWGQEKIAKAEMMLVSVWDYLQSQKELGNDPQQGVAEGSNDTIYPNAEVIKLRNGRPIGEIYQDENGWGFFHYGMDSGNDFIDSREDAIEGLRDLHQETGRSRRDTMEQGMAEGSSTNAEVTKRAKAAAQKAGKTFNTDVEYRLWYAITTQANAATRKADKKQGVAESNWYELRLARLLESDLKK